MIVVFGSQPSLWVWLGPVLLFAASLVATGAALFGVLRSNKTNRDAIIAADNRSKADRETERNRDFRLWQRDTLLRLGDEIVEDTIEAHENYGEIVTRGYDPSAEPLAEVDRAVRKIHVNIARLRLIGAHEAAERCTELHRAVNPTRGLGDTIVELYDHEGQVISAEVHGKSAQHEARRVQLDNRIHELMLGIYSARDAFVEAVERELARTNEPPNPTAAQTA